MDLDNKDMLVDIFTKSSILNAKVNSDLKINLSVENISDIQLAIEKAYIDMNVRTLPGYTRNEEVDTLLTELSNKFYYFFNQEPFDEVNFNKWHTDNCSWFCNEFNSIVNQMNNILKINYGKAQKIINMTFKYIYCYFSDADEKYFENCHVAMDSVVLNWFFNNVLQVYNINHTRIYKSNSPCWSNLKQGNDNAPFTYLWYQNQIKEYLGSTYNNLLPKNPFKAEFYIWSM